MSKRILTLCVAAVLALVIIVPANAQEGKWAASDDPTAKSMIEMERLWAEEACTHNGITKTMLAEDFQGTSPDGRRYAKVQAIEPSKTEARDCRLHEAKVRLFGDNMAVAYGSESFVLKGKDGKEHTLSLVWTDTWLKRNGKWQVVAAQDTDLTLK